MSKIVDIEVLRLCVRVRFDGGESFSVRKKDVKNFALTAGAEFDFEQLYQRICAFQAVDAYEAALDILDRSAKTEHEIRQRLLQKGYLAEVCDSVCERLVSARLVDDKYIAERIASSMSMSGKGRYAVKRKLRARGINDDDSEDALEEIDEEKQNESALIQAKKLYKRYANEDRRKAKQKLYQALARRGFSYDSIEYALNRIDFSES